MMEWDKLLTAKRYQPLIQTSLFRKHDRSQFQREYDRMVFSSPFRRLQNKTQVFPLPGNIFVHNRLTHSLEVASVGRSLGYRVSCFLKRHNKVPASFELVDELGTIVSTACLAHDLGNPPFGHSGEEAISSFFASWAGLKYQDKVSKQEWTDLCHFEGNANTFRLLVHSFNGRRPGGYTMTYSTLASVVKYPFQAVDAKSGFKYGFFQSEKEIYRKIAGELGIPSSADYHFARYPLVYLVEAADDICYEIMDIEDAHKLKIISYDETLELLMSYYDSVQDKEDIDIIHNTFKIVTDKNERIAFLRAGIINKLIGACTDIWTENYDRIMQGDFDTTLIKGLSGYVGEAYRACSQVAYSRIYIANIVTQIQLAGFKILRTLLEKYTEAVIDKPNSYYSRNLLSLMSMQYKLPEEASVYEKLQSVVDFVSGMTDSYALNLYRKIEGIELPEIYKS